MNFYDYMKDKIKFTAIYFINTLLIVLVMYLSLIIDGWKFPERNAIYALCLSIIIYVCFILYDYNKNRLFYRSLNRMISVDDSLEALLNIQGTQSIEQDIYKKILLNIYKLHYDKLSIYEEKQEQYRHFINRWVHQMKTPVSIINLLLQDSMRDTNKEAVESIREENEKIAHGLDMMLYTARLNEFNLDFQVEEIDIVSAARAVINENKKALIKYSIFPKITGDKEAIVETDKKWISFVINQILLNAIKYTKNAEKDRNNIVFEIKKEEERVILSIEDEGIGIPKEDISRVFRAFFTGKNGRSTSESTGMGMYLSKKICDELGHELFVESEVSKGAKFTIIFKIGKNLFKM